MLKKLLNQATLPLTITAKGPLLIKSGLEGGADPAVPDMQFVRSNGQVYLPGSSLKGVFRSYAEKIARTVGARCCNPFDDTFCGKRAEGQNDGRVIYRERRYSCRICQLFGSTVMASRVRFEDAYPQGDIKPEVRTNVAIDRVLGSVAAGPFDMEVVTKGTFKTEIHLRNFELWQLGLLALVLRDLCLGYLPLGFAKSRGLGEVEASVGLVQVKYLGTQRDGNGAMILPDGRALPLDQLYGLGALATEEDRAAYGLDRADMVAAVGEVGDDWLGVVVKLDGDVREAAFRACVEGRWAEVVNHDQLTH